MLISGARGSRSQLPPALALWGLLALAGCGQDTQPATDVDALTACHQELSRRGVTAAPPWPTTTREEGAGWVVNVWTKGRAEGTPNYVCEVAPAGDGVAVTEVRP